MGLPQNERDPSGVDGPTLMVGARTLNMPSRLENSQKGNNFGALRLLLTILVIVSHSPQVIDGNPSREIMIRTFGTISLGSAAVDAFFIISGYLITKSFVESPSVVVYLAKRVFRIIPAFLVSFWICALVVAPLVGAANPLHSLATMKQLLFLAARLLPPEVPGAFPGMSHPDLNVSMWTIAYEFRCYAVAAILGLFGLYSRKYRPIVAAATLVFLLMNTIGVPEHLTTIGESLTGSFYQDVRFSTTFGAGACVFLFRDAIRFTHRGAFVSAVALVTLLFSHRFAEAGLVVFGSYLIFWFVFEVRLEGLQNVGRHVDLSYGIYLYAWTVQSVIVWHDRTIDPWVLSLVSCLLAAAIASVSWVLIERPALRFVRNWRGIPERVPAVLSAGA